MKKIKNKIGFIKWTRLRDAWVVQRMIDDGVTFEESFLEFKNLKRFYTYDRLIEIYHTNMGL